MLTHPYGNNLDNLKIKKITKLAFLIHAKE